VDARDVMLGQIEALRLELLRCRTAIDSKNIDPSLRDRVEARLSTELTRLDRRRVDLGTRVTNNQPLDGCWRDLRTLEDDCAKVFGECLAFVEGAWARAHQLDEGLCAASDMLLDDLGHWSDVPWNRFTLLATSERYQELAGIIRVKYPDVSVWALPLVAHEFGHYVARELRQTDGGEARYPFQDRLKVADEGRGEALHTKQWHHLQEYFADVFATYTMGPAYAAAFMLLRMNPLQAQGESLTHPSGAARVHGILWMLDAMEEREKAAFRSSFRDVTTMLRDVWAQAVQGAGIAGGLTPAATTLAAQRTSELFGILTAATPPQLQFGWAAWLRAQAIAADLSATPPDGATRRDIVNGAWLARLQLARHDPQAVKDISSSALKLYGTVPPRRPVVGSMSGT
jgi:hypothetical protein